MNVLTLLTSSGVAIRVWWLEILYVVVAAAAVLCLCALAVRAIRSEDERILCRRLFDNERLVCHLHDPLLQGMQGIVLKAQVIASEIPLDEPTRQRMEALLDQADVVIAQAVDRVMTLRSGESLLTQGTGGESPSFKWRCRFRTSPPGD